MRVMAVGAHADDIELGCAGTLMKHLDNGDEVTMLTVTDTEVANYDGQMRRTREDVLKESKAAAEIIGAKSIHGDLRNKTLAYSWELIEFLNERIDRLGIELIYTHWDQDMHQDHSAIGRASLNAGRHVPRILMYRSNWYQTSESFRGNFYVDISKYFDRKVAALKAYETEYRMRGEGWIDFFKNVCANYGQEIGVAYAECFMVIKYLT